MRYPCLALRKNSVSVNSSPTQSQIGVEVVVIKVSHLHNWMQDLDDELRARIQQKMISKTYDSGAVIYGQGDEASYLFQVKAGRVKVCNYSEEGKEILFSILRAGDCFGEMSLIDHQPRFNSVSAYGQTELNCLHRHDFLHFYQTCPQVAQALNLMFCRRLRITFNSVEGLTLMGVRERLAVTLLREADADDQGLMQVDLSQEMLGKMLNATRQSIGKELKYFESEGWIQLHYGKIQLIDRIALEQRYSEWLGQGQVLPDYSEEG